MITTIFFDLNNVIEVYESVDNEKYQLCLNVINKRYPNVKNKKLTQHLEDTITRFSNVSEIYPFQYYYIFWKELMKEISGKEPGYSNVLFTYKLFINEYIKSIEIYPDVMPILKKLKNKYNLGIIANGNYIRCNRFLIKFKINKYFRDIITSDEIGVQKPNPLIFKYALSSFKARPNESIMVGDRLDNDILGANTVGINTIRILRGNYSTQKATTELEIPNVEIHSLDELEDWIKKF